MKLQFIRKSFEKLPWDVMCRVSGVGGAGVFRIIYASSNWLMNDDLIYANRRLIAVNGILLKDLENIGFGSNGCRFYVLH